MSKKKNKNVVSDYVQAEDNYGIDNSFAKHIPRRLFDLEDTVDLAKKERLLFATLVRKTSRKP